MLVIRWWMCAGVGEAEQKQGRCRRCAQRAVEELIGAAPATKTRGGGHQQMMRSQEILKVLWMQRIMDGNLVGDEIPRVVRLGLLRWVG